MSMGGPVAICPLLLQDLPFLCPANAHIHLQESCVHLRQSPLCLPHSRAMGSIRLNTVAPLGLAVT